MSSFPHRIPAPRRLAMLLGLALAATACGTSSTGPGNAVSLLGTWHYTGARTTGQQLNYNGMLQIDRQQNATFNGSLDAEGTDLAGRVSRIAGVVSGRVETATQVSLDVQLLDGTRHHVGTLRGDTISGSWIGDDASVGTFLMVRAGP